VVVVGRDRERMDRQVVVAAREGDQQTGDT
jgi:hypothetical protein